eukprot:jgi/Tetstr1/457423/TSEL_004209.t1
MAATDAERAKAEVNLKVLRRFDAATEEILAHAPHVALYDFNVPESKWNRKDIEGSLFLVRRSAQPQFRLLVMNKKSPNNYTEDVTADFSSELNPPYLIYRNAQGEVVGIWFYQEGECEAIQKWLEQVQAHLAVKTPPPIDAKPQTVAQPAAAPQAAAAAAPRTQASPSGSQLLPPSFFTGSAAATTATTATATAAVAAVAAAAPAEAGDVNPLERLFASAMRTTDQPRPAAAQAPAEAPAGPSKRERVWSAVQNLLANDQFLDMIVAELDRSGAL